MALVDGGRMRGEKHSDALLREIREVNEQYLSDKLIAAGFDMPGNAILALASVALNGGRVDGLSRALEVDDAKAFDLVSRLVQGGYAEHVDDSHTLMRVTKRGDGTLVALRQAVMTARWADFPFRLGDIVISTPAKSGTTWAQMICALLIFGTPDLPAPLSELSPWLDWVLNPRDTIFSQLAAQDHRRFIKTHTPLNEIAIDPRVTYIVIARHPLDIALSMYHQFNNIDRSRVRQLADHLPQVEPDGTRMPSPHEWLVGWIDANATPRQQASMPGVMWHLSEAWKRRDQANIVLLHYDDLLADLAGEMHRLAVRLCISPPEYAWPGLVEAATFKQMRHAADRLQPLKVLKDNAAFFRSGTSGSGRDLLTTAELDRYHARTRELASPDFMAWLLRC